MAKGSVYQPKNCAKCGAVIHDRELGNSWAVATIQQKTRTKEQRFLWRNDLREYDITRSSSMRPQVMLCMECAEKFVDVINDFVGEGVHDDVA